jgi:dienelactone hydrolase
MADVLLFHHARGLTPGVYAFADRLRAAGHQVAVPDLFDGRTFASLDDGVAHADGIGFDLLVDRGVAAAEGLAPGLVTAGFSLGVLPAQKLAQTRPGVRGALLFSSAVPASAFGSSWPDGLALQMHLVEDDPWAEEDRPAAEELARTVPGAELYLYPGRAHLPFDDSVDEYDPATAAQMLERSLAFLDRCGEPVNW